MERREGREHDVHVVDLAQPALVGMHPGEVVNGIAGEKRGNHLSRVAELLEGDPRGVEGGRIRIIDARRGRNHVAEDSVDCLESRRSLERMRSQQVPQPAHALSQPRRPRCLQFLACLAQQARFATP